MAFERTWSVGRLSIGMRFGHAETAEPVAEVTELRDEDAAETAGASDVIEHFRVQGFRGSAERDL